MGKAHRKKSNNPVGTHTCTTITHWQCHWPYCIPHAIVSIESSHTNVLKDIVRHRERGTTKSIVVVKIMQANDIASIIVMYKYPVNMHSKLQIAYGMEKT